MAVPGGRGKLAGNPRGRGMAVPALAHAGRDAADGWYAATAAVGFLAALCEELPQALTRKASVVSIHSRAIVFTVHTSRCSWTAPFERSMTSYSRRPGLTSASRVRLRGSRAGPRREIGPTAYRQFFQLHRRLTVWRRPDDAEKRRYPTAVVGIPRTRRKEVFHARI